jgi:hypothetical protein
LSQRTHRGVFVWRVAEQIRHRATSEEAPWIHRAHGEHRKNHHSSAREEYTPQSHALTLRTGDVALKPQEDKH